VVFAIGDKEIGFDIQNKTDTGIKINWDELSMIFPGGKSSRVIHSGVKLVDRNSPQAPTTSPPNAKVSDFLIPSGENGGWRHSRLFKGNNILAWDNKEFIIYFPLEIKGAKKEYNFKRTFAVSPAACRVG
jgi:hypothetical protein